MTRRMLRSLITVVPFLIGCDGAPPTRPQTRTGDRLVIPVQGMQCSSCEAAISRKVMGIDGVNAVAPSASDAEVILWLAPDTDLNTVTSSIESLGFTVESRPLD
ncbi:MAG: heavy metal-associated domain-containing protein [Phycisphaerales bacterium]|nr:heavy metal-associated domain-containing protein [Phycisphaerales bacterium]